MDDLILNEFTRKQLELAMSKPTHAYLFVGPRGLGKTNAAKKFADILVGAKSAGDRGRWVLVVAPIDGKKISIKQTVAIRDFINTSKPANISSKVVIIDDAENMSIEAMNALLLTLEEPTGDAVLILISENTYKLPATVLSRLQKIIFRKPSKSQIQNYLLKLGVVDEKIIEETGPYPALLANTAQLKGEGVERVRQMSQDFFNGGISQRLTIASSVKDRIEVQAILNHISTKTTVINNDFERWLKLSGGLILAYIHLYNNGNPKFILENLALEFE